MRPGPPAAWPVIAAVAALVLLGAGETGLGLALAGDLAVAGRRATVYLSETLAVVVTGFR